MNETDWEDRISAAWAAFDGLSEADFLALIEKLAAELPPGRGGLGAGQLPAVHRRHRSDRGLHHRGGGRAAGLVQRYLVADDPDWDHAVRATGAASGCAAGIDYLIGEPELCGRGYGTAAISVFTTLTFERYPQADAVVAIPQQANVASWRALERAGYRRWWAGRLESADPSDAGPAYLYGMRRPATATAPGTTAGQTGGSLPAR